MSSNAPRAELPLRRFAGQSYNPALVHLLHPAAKLDRDVPGGVTSGFDRHRLEGNALHNRGYCMTGLVVCGCGSCRVR